MRSSIAVAMAAASLLWGCKRDVDMVIPDTGAATTATASVAPVASATAPASTETVEPLATLSSARVGPVPMPATPKPGDGGTAALPTSTAGLPTSTAGLPTSTAPTGTATAPAAGAQPQECQAAQLMRKLGRANEAEILRTKCVEKGGKDPFI